VLHWNGGGWSAAKPIELLLRDLQGVFALSPSEVLLVSSSSGQVIRWNGTHYVNEPGSDHSGLMAIHGSSATDIWAVGRQGNALHRDGTGWTRIATDATTVTLNDVWVHGPSLAVAVGDSGTVRMWNGSAWSTMSSGTSAALTSVWGSGPSDIWAAGAGGTLLRFNGTAWLPVASGTTANLNAVWGTSSTAVWAAGNNGTLLRFDGTRWTSERTGTRRNLGAVWAASASDLWLAGDTVVLHKN
jgi:hypothetical protein